MTRIIRRAIIAAFLLLQAVAPVSAQPAEPGAEEPAAGAPEIEPIPASQIADRALDVAVLLRDAAIDADFSTEVRAIRDDFSAGKRRIENLRVQTLERLDSGGPVSRLEEAEKEWSRLRTRLDDWLRTLSSRAGAVVSVLETVRAEKALWTHTRDAPTAEERSPELAQVIEDVVESTESVEQQVRAFRDSIFDLQVSVGDAKAVADDILADLRSEIRERRRNLLRIDSEPLWTVLGAPGLSSNLAGEIAATWRDSYDAVREYFSEQWIRSLRYLAALLILVAILVFLRQKARVWVEQDRSLQPVVDLFERPVAAGLILVVLFEDLLDPTAPTAWSAVLGLILLFAVLRLLPRVLNTTNRSWAHILVALFLLLQMTRLTPDGTPLHRLVLLLLSLAGCAASVWFVRKLVRGRADISPGWLRATKLAARSAAVLFLVGAIADVVGSVAFSMVVTAGTLRAVFAAVVLVIVAILVRALVRAVMLVPSVRRLGMVSQRGDVTRRTLFRVITLVAVVVWITVTLRGFMILDPVLKSLGTLLDLEIPVGKFTLTPGDVLVFALVIWASFKLARAISFALDVDVLPHMHLPRGVPGALTRLTRYAVIAIGVMVAFSAAGFSVDRITIVFGALGVGIGFGLQNVVSNFVSGLILLFERPIQVGDRVQLATVEGVVMDIGMRASTIRSYSGADIVVPNANLISAEVVNWTLRDRTRRMEIRVGVAYGTDPATIIDILVDVATKHPHVDDNPKPEAVFVDFGESSLDFQLRAWTAAARYFNVSSELRVAIAQALKEAGIQIPFPQRDLHLRSMDDTVTLQSRRDAHDLD